MKTQAAFLALAFPLLSHADPVLVETESFENLGGWELDTQFIDNMGSPYLIAHGLGKPVADATTDVTFPAAGNYKLWVRTKNWVAKFADQVDASAAPGSVSISDLKTTVALSDLTGFDGRCDAILFALDPAFVPDNTSEVLPAWRRKMMGVTESVINEDPYDIIFVGGGYAGACGAISAARMGLKVALIQNRPVLGGNGSSEVRVWAQGKPPLDSTR